MRQAFTLIELMIVIAIIAIIAAIAIPNLLESRISSNEAAAAASLKSGIHPAQVTYQSGSYVDLGGPFDPVTGGNGIGDYAQSLNYLAGAITVTLNSDTAGSAPSLALSMLPATWNLADGVVQNSSFIYDCASLYETSFVVTCWPVDTTGGSVGRRRFAINAGGQVFASAPSITNAAVTPLGTASAIIAPFGASGNATAHVAWSPYRR